MNYSKYEVKFNEVFRRKIITKDGHNMFHDDIVHDLNRKSYLEENKINLEKQITQLKIQNEAFQAQYNVDDKKLIELQTDINQLKAADQELKKDYNGVFNDNISLIDNYMKLKEIAFELLEWWHEDIFAYNQYKQKIEKVGSDGG